MCNFHLFPSFDSAFSSFDIMIYVGLVRFYVWFDCIAVGVRILHNIQYLCVFNCTGENYVACMNFICVTGYVTMQNIGYLFNV